MLPAATRSRRLLGATLLLGLVAAPTALVTSTSAAASPTLGARQVTRATVATSADTATPRRRKHHKPAMQFSHETVVDEQRNGFEPDILIDTKDRMYTSVPNGSSEGTSFVWSSRDHGKSFQLVPGNVLQGKPATCNGGGDTELQLDKSNNLFLSDLQNLTNLSNSVTKDGGLTWQTTCTGAVNTPVDRMWYAVQGSLGKPGFAIYEEYDAVASGADPANPAGNQLVEEVSSDGVNFVPVVNPDFTTNCLGGGAYNCVSNDEGISGNQLVTPKGEVVIGHSTADGNGVQISYSTPSLVRGPTGAITAASAHWHSVTINKSICPDKKGVSPGICGATQFVTVAQDSAGDLYASFSSRKLDKSGNQVGPYNVYVSVSRNNAKTWSRPVRVSRGGSNSFSWVTAGSKGRVAMAWYHADMARGKSGYTFDDLTKAEFSVQESMSINALAKHPTYKVTTVSEHPIKYGPICTQGLNCVISGGDRSLGDFLEVSKDNRGALALSYVNDTSNTYTTGATGFAENGPPVVVRQIHGPSLIKGKHNPRGYIFGPGKGPGARMNRITDGAHDDYYSANAARTPAGDALDLRGARLNQSKNHKRLRFTMRLASLKSLAVPASLGGTTAEWILRFTTYDPHTLGNGHIYYAGMESVSGGKPTYFDGDTSAPAEGVQLSMIFSSAHTAGVAGHIVPKTGRIVISAPLKDFPGITRAHPVLYSATAFSGTTAASLSAPNPTAIQGEINQVDATMPFGYVVKRLPKKRAASSAHRASSSSSSGSSSPDALDKFANPVVGGVGGGAVLLVLGSGLVWNRRRHRSGAAA